MITKNHLQRFGFSIRERRHGFFGETNGIKRREAVLNLPNNRGLYVRGKKMFFIDKMCVLWTKSNEWLWRQRSVELSKMDFASISKIVNDAKSGLWLENNEI